MTAERTLLDGIPPLMDAETSAWFRALEKFRETLRKVDIAHTRDLEHLAAMKEAARKGVANITLILHQWAANEGSYEAWLDSRARQFNRHVLKPTQISAAWTPDETWVVKGGSPEFTVRESANPRDVVIPTVHFREKQTFAAFSRDVAPILDQLDACVDPRKKLLLVEHRERGNDYARAASTILELKANADRPQASDLKLHAAETSFPPTTKAPRRQFLDSALAQVVTQRSQFLQVESLTPEGQPFDPSPSVEYVDPRLAATIRPNFHSYIHQFEGVPRPPVASKHLNRVSALRKIAESERRQLPLEGFQKERA